jgi:hypothetical protein
MLPGFAEMLERRFKKEKKRNQMRGGALRGESFKIHSLLS